MWWWWWRKSSAGIEPAQGFLSHDFNSLDVQGAILFLIRVVNILTKCGDVLTTSFFRVSDNSNFDDAEVADVASLVRHVADCRAVENSGEKKSFDCFGCSGGNGGLHGGGGGGDVHVRGGGGDVHVLFW